MLNDRYTHYKLNYPKYIIILKSGNFYISLDNDAIIINKIFNYKITEFGNIAKVGVNGKIESYKYGKVKKS